MKRVLILILTIGLLAVGCSSIKTTTPEESAKANDSQKPPNESETTEESPTEPLTGLPAEGGSDHPIVMTMINNHPEARPQTGLNRADIVFEVLAEGEITRFAAFYHSQAEGIIGPVRSVRPYYLDLAEGFDAVVAHAGGSPDAKERLNQARYPHLDGIAGGEEYFRREDFRQAPHNLYTSMEKLLQGVEDRGFADRRDFPQLLFADSAGDVSAGEKAQQIDIVYGPLYEIGYTYDSEAEQYIRYTEGEKQIDLETEEPLTMDNVLVMKATHRVLDDQGRREVDVTGSGEGWLFQKGTVREIEWQYENGFPRPYADGKELPLVPGKTWVNVIPQDADVNYNE